MTGEIRIRVASFETGPFAVQEPEEVLFDLGGAAESPPKKAVPKKSAPRKRLY